jgi:hypothetical protein
MMRHDHVDDEHEIQKFNGCNGGKGTPDNERLPGSAGLSALTSLKVLLDHQLTSYHHMIKAQCSSAQLYNSGRPIMCFFENHNASENHFRRALYCRLHK